MRCLLFVFGLLFTGALLAADAHVPTSLEPWREWVLHGEEHRECPFFSVGGYGEPGNHVCTWAGPLSLDATRSGARFSQTWRLYREGWLTLPGDAQTWPDEARVGNRSVPVVLRQGRPRVLLPAGEHRLAGLFAWSRQPASLPIPDETGLVSLTVDGAPVAFPRIEGGRLLLGGEPAASGVTESLRVTVHRKLADGIPMRLETRLQLEVSGPGREVLLGRLLPDGFAPLHMVSPLPARIETDGRLRMQLRPGAWQLSATARAQKPVAQIAAPTGEGPWAQTEIWSWQSDDRLRITSAQGGKPVDPTRVDVPPEWRNLPAFRIDPGEALTVSERSRGLSDSLQNRLTLQRQMWRDFDGAGYTMVDNITGRMQTAWRLDMARPHRLESASAFGENLLVTRGAGADLSGVEVRSAQLALETIGRVPAESSVLPATGWTQDFTDVSTRLSLPPAHRLVAAFGVDRTSGDWVGQWRLLDYFLVLLIAVALGRLFGLVLGGMVLVLLALGYHEPGMPLWAWLAVAALIALARFAPQGRLARASTWARNAAFAVLVLLALPFAGNQLRLAVFPQLEPEIGGQPYAGRATMDDAVRRGQSAPTAEEFDLAATAPSLAKRSIEQVIVSGVGIGRAGTEATALARYAEGTLVQTGPGIPEWGGSIATLEWSGPVAAGQTMRLLVLPPAALRGLRVLVVILLAAVLWRIASRLFDLPGLPAVRGAAGVLVAAVALTSVSVPKPAHAQTFPDNRLLGELRQRLLEPPDCAPRCAEIRSADIDAAGDRLTMELAVDALEGVAVALPGSSGGWRPRSVSVDGNAERLFFRDSADVLWLPLDPGQHTVALDGPLPPADSVQVPFTAAPRRVRVTATGWDVTGVADGRLASGALELVRIRTAGTAGPLLESERFPAFVEIERSVHFNVDWQVRTVVTRIAPEQGGFTVTVPLMAGEQPLDDDLTVKDGAVTVSLAAGRGERRWISTLPMTSPVTFTAPLDSDSVDVWRLMPGPAWRLRYAGVPIIAAASVGNAFSPEFRPLPGESLAVELERPTAIEGTTLTFDRVTLDHIQGRRGSDSSLSVAYRSTRGGTHAIRLPADARVVSVNTDGAAQSVRPVAGELVLPVLPGTHNVDIEWRSDTAMASRIETPGVDLKAAAGNVHQRLSVPADRWVLLAAGPSLGPAVLYWSELAVFILIALALGRTTTTPLRTHHWLLLGLGFSTFSWGVLMLLGVWLFALAQRRTRVMPAARWLYNLLQTGLALLTVTTLLALLIAIPQALLGYPDMHVVGNGSSGGRLQWFSDRVAGELPAASVWSVPLWVYKGAILLWALWLAFALLKWLPWAWRCWTDGGLWRGRIIASPDEASDSEEH